jgi:hypothetical protein
MLAAFACSLGAAATAPSATAPRSAPASAPAKAKTVALQVKTMDFKNAADMVLNRILTARFAGATGDTNGITVRPAERTLLNRLKDSATQLQLHPHDAKLAVRMMSDMNSALFMSDTTMGNRRGTRANERTIQPFFEQVRDAAASSSPIMVVVNIAGSADHLLNQQKISEDGTLAVIPGTNKPAPWLNPDNAADKKLIAQLTTLRDAALDILELEMKDGTLVDRVQISDAVETPEGTRLEGIVRLKEGKFDGIKLVDTKPADDVRTTGKLQPSDIQALSDALDKTKPAGRPRYVEFLNADKRILDEAGKKQVVQSLTNDNIIFTVRPTPAK